MPSPATAAATLVTLLLLTTRRSCSGRSASPRPQPMRPWPSMAKPTPGGRPGRRGLRLAALGEVGGRGDAHHAHAAHGHGGEAGVRAEWRCAAPRQNPSSIRWTTRLLKNTRALTSGWRSRNSKSSGAMWRWPKTRGRHRELVCGRAPRPVTAASAASRLASTWRVSARNCSPTSVRRRLRVVRTTRGRAQALLQRRQCAGGGRGRDLAAARGLGQAAALGHGHKDAQVVEVVHGCLAGIAILKFGLNHFIHHIAMAKAGRLSTNPGAFGP